MFCFFLQDRNEILEEFIERETLEDYLNLVKGKFHKEIRTSGTLPTETAIMAKEQVNCRCCT